MRELERIRRARAGDPEAREMLARRWLPRVYAVALAVTGRRVEAEDVTQDAFLRAFRSLPRLKSADRFGAWLLQIARNAALDRVRRTRRPLPLVADPPAPREEADDLPPGWLALSGDERLVCWLHVCGDMQFRDIAQLLQVSKSQAHRIYRKGIKTLRKEVLACNEAKS